MNRAHSWQQSLMSDTESASYLRCLSAVPPDRPFTREQARHSGLTDRQLAEWTSAGFLVRPVRGVYHAAALPDGLELRLQVLRLVVPEDAVVTDRTAAWLHGAAMVLAPGDHLVVPQVSMFRSPGYRLRNGVAASGERTFAAGEVVEVGGLRVTSRLRTACDLGMMRGRESAFAAMGAMAAIADYSPEDLVNQGARFRGYRRVRQFRELAPRVDPRPQSPPEHILLLRWTDITALPPPRPQLPVAGPDGWLYLDLGVEHLRYAAEYDGKLWHGPERREHDAERREWLARTEDWIIDVFADTDVFGRQQAVEATLREGIASSRRRLGSRAWHGQDRG